MRIARGVTLVAAAGLLAAIGGGADAQGAAVVAGRAADAAGTAMSRAATPPVCEQPAAEVSRTGAVAGATCAGTRSTLIGTGGYEVTFPAVPGTCVPVASLRSADLPPGTPPGEIAADPVPGQPRLYQVRTFDSGGVPADRAFQIGLECVPGGDAGTVTIRNPAASAQVRVACGMSRSAIVLATAQNGGGLAVSWAGADAGRCRIGIHLTGVPRPGHPVRVAWQLRR